MSWPSDISDDEIDRLLAGHKPEDGRLDGVAQLLQGVGRAYPEESTAALEATHVAAMLETAKFLAENGESAEKSLDPALAFQARSGHIFAFKNLAAHKWASAAVLSGAGLLAFGGAAYAGVLPAPVQEATSDLVQQVGISIPKPHDSKQAVNNGVRDWGAGVGNGKGQGGIRRDLNDFGTHEATATGTVGVGRAKGSNATSSTVKGAGTASAKGTPSKPSTKASTKARTKARKRIAPKKTKRKSSNASSNAAGKKPSAVEVDRKMSRSEGG